MPTKTTVAEFVAFYNDPEVWANEAWYEDARLVAGGVELGDDIDWSSIPSSLTAADVITIDGGVLLRPKKPSAMSSADAFDFEAVFKAWRKRQTTATVSVSVPKDRLDDLKAFLKGLGGKVA